MDDDALLAALGVEPGVGGITELRHVRSQSDRRAAEEVATRHPCADFDSFEPLFEAVKADIAEGRRRTRRFERKAEIEMGRFFIVDGLTAYVAEAGEAFVNESGNRDQRLRVIFDNGTESNLLSRSLQKALTEDKAGRRVTEPDAGPLFDHEDEMRGRRDRDDLRAAEPFRSSARSRGAARSSTRSGSPAGSVETDASRTPPGNRPS